jgi:hypothetical protein
LRPHGNPEQTYLAKPPLCLFSSLVRRLLESVLFVAGRVLGEGLEPGEERAALHVGLEDLGDVDTLYVQKREGKEGEGPRKGEEVSHELGAEKEEEMFGKGIGTYVGSLVVFDQAAWKKKKQTQ